MRAKAGIRGEERYKGVVGLKADPAEDEHRRLKGKGKGNIVSEFEH